MESVALKEEITKLLGSVNKYEEELIKHERKLIMFQEFQEQFSICAWESKVLATDQKILFRTENGALEEGA